MLTVFPDQRHPIAIAHRAANDLTTLAVARSRGVDVIEGDIWLHQNRLEVRHTKTAWRAPLLWDKWTIEPGWSPRLTLPEILAAAGDSTPLMLDLKGWNRELPDRVLDAIRDQPPRHLVVCAQTWSFVDRFESCPNVSRVYSIGSQRMLRRFLASPRSADAPAISINARLLNATAAESLSAPDRTIIAWNVPTFERAEQLVALGVHGIISENYELLTRLKQIPLTNN